MPCYSPLKGYKDHQTGGIIFKRTSHTTHTMEVACGQCFGCRLDRTRMWAMRLVHEAELHLDDQGSCFVTLTYRDQRECNENQLKHNYYLPPDTSLHKSHFQKFIKRLRKQFPQKIRYFHCGEYGDENLRPHYHACLFNVRFDDQVVYQDKEGLITYESETMAELWPYGFSTIAELNFETAAYTAGYILKKVNGRQADDEYLRNNADGVASWVLPPYVTMSLKPGIGKKFYEKYKSDFFPSDTCPVPGKGVFQKVPRYYETIYADSSPAGMEKIKELRKKFKQAHLEDFTPERLQDRYICARAKYANHKRDL